MAFVSHFIQSNVFESNASANADESNANAAVTGESNASANATFALEFANAFEHKPGLEWVLPSAVLIKCELFL